jgi:uncharacterized lipoprotein NlpE involved in copper resistance
MVSAAGIMCLLNACQSAGTKASATPEWVGIYAGIIPCADCPGIETQLTLNADTTFALSREYLDRDSAPQVEEGKFTWSADGNVVIAPEGETRYTLQLKVAKNSLTQLDIEGKIITGELAASYVLARVAQ